MMETTVVVMNDGDSYATRDVPFWDGANFLDLDPTRYLEPYKMETALKDMEYFLRLSYAKTPFNPSNIFQAGFDSQYGYTTYVTGPLYLRCDAGNPGALYASIEFATARSFANGLGNHVTLDNLNCSYCNAPVGGADLETGMTNDYVYMQNCEFGWSGGKVNSFTAPGDYKDDMFTAMFGHEEQVLRHYYMQDGGSCNVTGSHERILNNYVHHQFQESIALETFANKNSPNEDDLFQGNLSEYCGFNMICINWDGDLKLPHIFTNVRFEDNMVLYTGFDCFNTQEDVATRDGPFTQLGNRMDSTSAFNMSTVLNPHDGTLSVSNNVMAFSAAQLLNIQGYTEEYSHIFDGNTYAQLPGMIWLTEEDYIPHDGVPRPWPPCNYITDPDTAIRDWLQDKHATIIRFDQ